MILVLYVLVPLSNLEQFMTAITRWLLFITLSMLLIIPINRRAYHWRPISISVVVYAVICAEPTGLYYGTTLLARK